MNTGFPIVSKVQSSVLFVIHGREGSNGEMPTPNIPAESSHLEAGLKICKPRLSGPRLAQPGHGSLTGQMSSNPSSSVEQSPKYSNTSLPELLGGNGGLGSLSEYRK